MNRKIKTGMLMRQCAIEREQINQDQRTVELSFSSEAPIERYFGFEVLSHEQGAMRMDRLKNGAPLLLNHDTEEQIGVVENAFIGQDKKGRALVRFSKSARAEEIFQDVIDGIRKNVSVGYLIHSMVLTEEQDGVKYYKAEDWEPIEISSVPVPADNSVGVGRAEEFKSFESIIKQEGSEMEPKKVEETPIAPVVDIQDIKDRARKEELGRVREITAIGEKHQLREIAKSYVDSGKSLDEFREAALAELEKRGEMTKMDPIGDIGMPESDKRAYSIVRAIHAVVTNDWSKAGLELEASRAIASKMGKAPQGFFAPFEALGKRDLVKGTGSAGGFTMQTDLLGGEFIDALRNRMMVSKLGARFLTGLQGDVAIPKMSAGATAYWVAENAAPTESQQTFAQVTMSPKTVGAFTDLARRLIIQSSLSVDEMVKTDLQTILAIALDQAALTGPGSGNAPTGITATGSIGSVAGGTNGLAPAFAHMVALESAVAIANADLGNLAYIMSAKARGKLKQTQRIATYGNDMIWLESNEPGFGTVNGYRSAATNQMPDNLTKGTSSGVCSAIIFGNFNDLLVGTWGPGIDVLVDPYTGSSAGTVRVRALLDCDIAVRNAASFAAMLDALCA